MIVFAHIPSAAGSTLWTVFREIYGRMNVKRMRGLGMPVTNDVVQQVVESDRGRVSVVGGHVRVNTRLQHADGVRFVTFLRDPTAILISRFLRSKGPEGRESNGHVEAARTPVPADDLEHGKETLTERIHVFGSPNVSTSRWSSSGIGWAGAVPRVDAKNTSGNNRTSPMKSGRSAASATRSTTNFTRSRNHCSTGSVPRRRRPTPRRVH